MNFTNDGSYSSGPAPKPKKRIQLPAKRLLVILLAVLLVTEARHRLRSRAIPSAFRGLPITLIYIGVLALAIYGFTGHSVIL